MIREVLVDNPFTYEGQPDGSSVLVVDPYTGCQLQCPYCFQWNDADWSKTIYVNMNISDKLTQHISNIDDDIYIGSKCDPYMQLEDRYRLTRRCLEVLSHCENHVYITTKSDNGLILKDLELLKISNTSPTVLMGLSNINQAGKGRLNSSIRIANELRHNGIDVWCFFTPVLPYIMDVDDMVDALDESIPVYFDKLRVMTEGNQDKKILTWINSKFPHYYDEYFKILYEGDISYYKEIYKKYKSSSRYNFLTDEWGV